MDKNRMMENLSTYNTLHLDKDELIRFALNIEENRDFSSRFNGINIGMSSGTSGNKLNYVSQLQTMEQIRLQLSDINPNVISAPPSMLHLLAREKDAGLLNVHPKILYSYAEVLDPKVRNYLGKVFGCPVHEVYQGSEGTYAMTCCKGNLHINEDIVFPELLDAKGQPTVDGEPAAVSW